MVIGSKISLSEEAVESRLARIRGQVAKPIPRGPDWTDPQPALVEGGCVLIGNKYHAADVSNLLSLGVTAVLNCASGGISRLPVDELRESGIKYAFTNVRQDDYSYPILHDGDGTASKHLEVAKSLYGEVKAEGGKVLFFCVAGQNRSATLAAAVMMLYGHSLDAIIDSCAKTRPFVLENKGFQRQLVELETILAASKKQKVGDDVFYLHGTPPRRPAKMRTKSECEREAKLVEIELLIPGLCTMEVKIPIESTIATVKKCLIDYANEHLLSYSSPPATISKSWVVLAMFGYDSMYDFPLEVEAIELDVQLERIKTMFNLEVIKRDANEALVRWSERCRFALVIYSVTKKREDGLVTEEPWTFVHEERPGAPATFLANNLMNTTLRAWDFVTGQAFTSRHPIVFSYAPDPRDRRQFMKISTNANEPQQLHAPGEGGILGMGENAIVHRVELKPTSAEGTDNKDYDQESMELSCEDGWDAAVKRPFSLSKMLAFLGHSTEAGLAKRMRFASALNSDGRVLYFYGLGVALSANAYNPNEYKFEATLLARYEEEFSTYTMKRFMQDYIAIPDRVPEDKRAEVMQLQANFTIISVKVLLISLLNAFRDLTLMGVQSFDFNHLNNVLVLRDHRNVRLIDIDGNNKGSIQFPSKYIQGSDRDSVIYKPSLDINLNSVLPTMVKQLFLGKGKGNVFVMNTKSRIWHAKPEEGKKILKDVLRDNFLPNNVAHTCSASLTSHGDYEDESTKADRYIGQVTEWFYAMLKKASPWDTWTNDIYDAMRCIDHLPVM